MIIGLGEVGRALHTVFEQENLQVVGRDLAGEIAEKHDVLHVCFPCKEPAIFAHQVLEYAAKYLKDGGLVIVHATVPVGTVGIMGTSAVHSPIRGVHPNLAGGIRTFVKYFGGPRATEAAAIFEAIGVQTRVTGDSRNTEALKLWDTTQYGLNIVLEKAMHAYCAAHGLDFDLIYGDANKTYNAGYATLGMGHVARPVLKHVDGKIGGHCVVPNARLLGDWIGDLITGFDDGLPNVHTQK